MSEENVEIVRRTMDAYNARDLTAYFELISDSISFRSRFSAVDDVVYRGHAELRRYFANLDEAWSRYEMQVERLVPVGDRVAALCHLHAVGRDSDLHLEEHPGVVFTVDAGKVVAMDSCKTHEETLATAGLKR